jgi:deoxyribodipyrimidine photo-lyase
MTKQEASLRTTAVNDCEINRKGRYVLYWMTSARRTQYNFALERAVRWANELDKPLVILEALRCDYRWASDRLHRFVIDGMRDNAAALAERDVLYHPYVEPARGAGRGLLAAIAQPACVVVADEFPCFFLPRMIASAGRQLRVRMEQVDGNGLLPLRATDRDYPTAYAFRRMLQKTLPEQLRSFPQPDPAAELAAASLASLPDEVQERWPGRVPRVAFGRGRGARTLPD